MREELPKPFKVVAFDAYGTLFDVHAAARRLAPSLGDKADELSDIWRIKQLEYTWLRSLMRDYRPFEEVTREGLRFAMKAVGIDNPALEQELLDLYMTLDAYPDVQGTLQKLKAAGRKTAILSNGDKKMLSAAVSSAGIENLLDAVLSVDDVRVYKTDPRSYGMVMERFVLTDPGEVLFVSSNAWDAAGAGHFGFQVAWLNRFHKQQEEIGPDPTVIVSSLDELCALATAPSTMPLR